MKKKPLAYNWDHLLFMKLKAKKKIQYRLIVNTKILKIVLRNFSLNVSSCLVKINKQQAKTSIDSIKVGKTG